MHCRSDEKLGAEELLGSGALKIAALRVAQRSTGRPWCWLSVLVMSLGCLNFEQAYANYCAGGRCPDGGNVEADGSVQTDAGDLGPDSGHQADGGLQADGGMSGHDAGAGSDGGSGCGARLCLVHIYSSGSGLRDVWANVSRVVAVGDDGHLVEWEGSSFSSLALSDYPLSLVSGTTNELWVAEGPRAVVHRRVQVGVWQELVFASTLDALFVDRSNTVWATSQPRIVQWNGGSWATVYDLWAGARLDQAIGDVWVSPSGEPWATSYNLILNQQDAGWVVTDMHSRVSSVFGRSSQDVWAVGADSTAFHRVGDSWSRVPVPLVGVGLHAVWVSSRGEAWIVGDRGTIVASGPDGGLENLSTGAFRDFSFQSVYGVDPGQLWVAGWSSDAGVLLGFEIRAR